MVAWGRRATRGGVLGSRLLPIIQQKNKNALFVVSSLHQKSVPLAWKRRGLKNFPWLHLQPPVPFPTLIRNSNKNHWPSEATISVFPPLMNLKNSIGRLFSSSKSYSVLFFVDWTPALRKFLVARLLGLYHINNWTFRYKLSENSSCYG